MRILRINLNHCEAALDFLTQTVRDLEVDKVFQYENDKDIENEHAWIAKSTERSAVWTCGNIFIQEISHLPEAGFSRAEVKGKYFYSAHY